MSKHLTILQYYRTVGSYKPMLTIFQWVFFLCTNFNFSNIFQYIQAYQGSSCPNGISFGRKEGSRSLVMLEYLLIVNF